LKIDPDEEKLFSIEKPKKERKPRTKPQNDNIYRLEST
jgi:hypothetical protein